MRKLCNLYLIPYNQHCLSDTAIFKRFSYYANSASPEGSRIAPTYLTNIVLLSCMRFLKAGKSYDCI